MDPQKLFTLEEANHLLSQVAPVMQQLQALQGSILTTNEQLDDRVHKLSQGNGYPIQDIRKQVAELTTHQLNLIEAFQSTLQQLESLGCVVKDVNAGLVDFYSMRHDELVCLCWRMGEEEIGFWHRVEEGFAGRQPLP